MPWAAGAATYPCGVSTAAIACPGWWWYCGAAEWDGGMDPSHSASGVEAVGAEGRPLEGAEAAPAADEAVMYPIGGGRMSCMVLGDPRDDVVDQCAGCV